MLLSLSRILPVSVTQCVGDTLFCIVDMFPLGFTITMYGQRQFTKNNEAERGRRRQNQM